MTSPITNHQCDSDAWLINAKSSIVDQIASSIKAAKHEHPTTNSSLILFKRLETWRSQPTVTRWMEDGPNEGYGDIADKFAIQLMVFTQQGRLNWRHLMLERVYRAFAANDTVELRARLVALVTSLVQWIVEIDCRTESSKRGAS
jgi:hypothetical protein